MAGSFPCLCSGFLQGSPSCPKTPLPKSPRSATRSATTTIKYYVEAAPEISDRDYDKLLERLKQLEAAHPELITPDSPTQRIGDQPVSELPQVEHRVPMLSIENTYSLDELKSFGARTAKLLGRRADRVGRRAEGRRRGRIAGL